MPVISARPGQPVAADPRRSDGTGPEMHRIGRELAALFRDPATVGAILRVADKRLCHETEPLDDIRDRRRRRGRDIAHACPAMDPHGPRRPI
jgi:hypothetical protein